MLGNQKELPIAPNCSAPHSSAGYPSRDDRDLSALINKASDKAYFHLKQPPVSLLASSLKAASSVTNLPVTKDFSPK